MVVGLKQIKLFCLRSLEEVYHFELNMSFKEEARILNVGFRSGGIVEVLALDDNVYCLIKLYIDFKH
jgi:hypothetical protein